MFNTMQSMISGSLGDIGRFVIEQGDESHKLLQQSEALGGGYKEISYKLDEIFRECSKEGWDGADAKPILEATLRNTKIFLKKFPLGVKSPEVGAEPDGAITLEWYKSPSKVISISIHPDEKLYFAAIIGVKKRHGVDFVSYDISNDLLELISQVTEEK